MGVHKDRVFPIKLVAVYQNKKEEMGYEKNVAETTSRRKS
jgi:hypothetical protein